MTTPLSKDTISGRKNSRIRQSSLSGQDLHTVPYESVTPGPTVPVSRQAVISNISAQITNPTLTANGTTLNLHTAQPLRAARKRISAATATSTPHPSSSYASIVTKDSSTLYSEPTGSISNPPISSARKLFQSGSSSGRRSPSNHLPVIASPPTLCFGSFAPSFSLAPRSDNRSSRSTFQAETHSSHSHHLFPHLHRHNKLDFDSLRTSDEEIEARIQTVERLGGFDLRTNLPPFTIDQNWSMAESDVQLHFTERPPEWYLVRFMDRTITPKDASGLLVSLRGHELGWLQQFVAISGTQVLAQYLSYISSKGSKRTEADHQLEYETLRCIKQIFNFSNATRDAFTLKLRVAQIASSFNSPRLPARSLVAELLTFLTYRIPENLNLITGALEAVSIANNGGNSPYEYWFAIFWWSILGWAKMGSSVGASDEVRKNATTESNINEYALSNLLLINGILSNTEDLDRRIQHERQMATAGLRQIMELCRSPNFDNLNAQLETLQDTIESDEKESRERLDQEIRDLTLRQEQYSVIHSGSSVHLPNLRRHSHEQTGDQKGELKSHYRIVTCTINNCGKSFSGEWEKARHIKSIHNPPTIGCRVCPYKQSRRDLFSEHCRKRHPGESIEELMVQLVQNNGNPLGSDPVAHKPKVVSFPRDCMSLFTSIASINTAKNRETCGLLLGEDKGGRYVVTTMLIPKQHATSDTCGIDEEELVKQFAEERSLITLGWIHTHPTQSCFMSSIDLHRHSAFQRILPESFAVVCAPTSTPNFGIFRLTDPGLQTIIECQETEAFHLHPEHSIYTDAAKGHVQICDLPLQIDDLRREHTVSLCKPFALLSEDTLAFFKGSLSRYRHPGVGHIKEEREEVADGAGSASEPGTPEQRPAALHPTKTPAQRSNVWSKLPSANHSDCIALPTDTSILPVSEELANPTPEVLAGFDVPQDEFGSPDLGHRHSCKDDASACNEEDGYYRKSFDEDNESCYSFKTVSKGSRSTPSILSPARGQLALILDHTLL